MSRNNQANRKKKLANKRDKLRASRAKVNAEKSKIATIYLDESGNTGHNIVDKNQPIFTLSACKFSNGEAEKLLALTGSRSPLEAHFKNLKRRKSGQDGIVRLMSHRLINKDHVKVELFHKNFMVTTKIVDLLIEHMLHLNGHDLYVNGANIGLSNMWFYCMPTFCGQDRVQAMYGSFVNMIKEQSEESISSFYESVEVLKEHSIHENFKEDLNLILLTRNYIHDALNGIDKTSLDPSIPALFSKCVSWGDIHPKGFHIIHDDSHSVEKQKAMFSQFMDWTQSSIELGYDRRKFKLPLRGKSLKFSSSESHPQLQVADIVASSMTYWADGVARDEKEDYLFLELNKLNLDKLTTSYKIWPTQDVTPSDLGTVHDGGLNAADHGAYFLMKAKANAEITT
ncbi:DUF3800 domain-containing protein [Agarivorans sp. QJM3NY_29]|uniref:DUF3800 domain-containing protein n=1 Tax=unclassified Agarivorans TaxID=2636026 RepID=UPI003D7C5BD1